MDVEKSKPKLSSIRTYAEDLAKTKEKRSSADKGEAALTVAADSKSDTKTETLPPKTFTRSKNTTPVVPSNKATQAAINDLIKIESSAPTKNPVPSGIETPVATFLAENEDSAPATIITDTKKDRFKLFPSIVESVKNWFGEIRREQARKKTPRYTVADTSRRKGVIQKATSNTGKAASADFASIQERIRQRKLAEENKPTTTWSANTETGFLLLPAPEEEKAPVLQNVKLVPKKSARFNDTPKTITSRVSALASELPKGPSGFEDPNYLAKIITEKPAVEVAKKEEEKVTEVQTLVTPEPIETKIKPVSEELPEEVTIQNDDTKVPEIAAELTTSLTESPRNILLRFNTNSIAITISSVALVVFMIGFVVYSSISEVTTATKEAGVKQAFTDSKVVEVNLGELSTNDLANKLIAVRQNATRITEVAIKINGTEIDPSISANLISKNLPADFAHSLTLSRVGFSGEQIPFVVLGITDYTTAKGGLLLSEITLYQDFVNTFGTNIPSPTNPKFIDASLSGVDVRVLKNTTGEEILLYAIIGNTVVITTDSMTLSALMPIINK